MIMLKESLEQFTAPVYGKTKRTAETYKTVATRCKIQLTQFVKEYQAVKNDQQLLREIRNDIDEKIRRYHEYCIKQHLIPLGRIRDLLLAGAITVEQALNAPTVKLSRAKHAQLKDAGWASHTPDMWLPFRRYTQVFEAKFETHDGTTIDPETWTLEKHFDYFKHLVI